MNCVLKDCLYAAFAGYSTNSYNEQIKTYSTAVSKQVGFNHYVARSFENGQLLEVETVSAFTYWQPVLGSLIDDYLITAIIPPIKLGRPYILTLVKKGASA